MGLGTDDGDEYLCSLKVHRLMTHRRTVLLFDFATKSEVTRLLAVPLDASDVSVFKDFVIMQDSYMEPTRVGSDYPNIAFWFKTSGFWFKPICCTIHA